MAKRRRDPERERSWRTTMAHWQASGQSVREYCQKHRLTVSAFYYWQRELRDRDAQSPTRRAGPASLPVTVIPTTTVAVEVRCPSGHVVALPACDLSTLRGLFAAMVPEAPC